MAQLASWAEQNPGDDWLRVYCWPNRAFVDGAKGPDRVDLDAIFPDRPVWITSCSWHSYWVNSNALNELGIHEDTEDPKFPIAMNKRDDNGRLTGWIKANTVSPRYTMGVPPITQIIFTVLSRASRRRVNCHCVTKGPT